MNYAPRKVAACLGRQEPEGILGVEGNGSSELARDTPLQEVQCWDIQNCLEMTPAELKPAFGDDGPRGVVRVWAPPFSRRGAATQVPEPSTILRVQVKDAFPAGSCHCSTHQDEAGERYPPRQLCLGLQRALEREAHGLGQLDGGHHLPNRFRLQPGLEHGLRLPCGAGFKGRDDKLLTPCDRSGSDGRSRGIDQIQVQSHLCQYSERVVWKGAGSLEWCEYKQGFSVATQCN